MKALLTYYSYSGHTDKVMKIFADTLKREGEVNLQRLKPKDEIRNFSGQCRAAFAKKRAILEDGIKYDASPYDLILIGSPVWAFAPTPAMNTYLDNLSGTNAKRAVVLLTSGSGLGVKKCFKNIRSALEAKGISKIDEINIPDRKLNDETYIRLSIEKIL